MAWWAWLIIWTVLVLGLLGMLAGLGYRLFRQFTGVMDALGELSDQVARLGENVEALAPEEPADRAILLGYQTVAKRHELHQERRAQLRQERRDARLRRGKLLLRPDTIPTLRKLPHVR